MKGHAPIAETKQVWSFGGGGCRQAVGTNSNFLQGAIILLFTFSAVLGIGLWLIQGVKKEMSLPFPEHWKNDPLNPLIQCIKSRYFAQPFVGLAMLLFFQVRLVLLFKLFLSVCEHGPLLQIEGHVVLRDLATVAFNVYPQDEISLLKCASH